MAYTTDELGWRKSLPDYRDDRYRYDKTLKAELMPVGNFPIRTSPQKKELAKIPHVDQGYTGSCTGEGTAVAVAVQRNVGQRSGSFIYYEARRMIGETNVDNGAYGRDACKVAANLGVPHHRLWPTELGPDGRQLRVHEDPSDKADKDAAKRKIFTYHPLVDLFVEARACLAAGHFFLGGFSVYDSIDDSIVEQFGIIEMPRGNFQGGHWVCWTGHDDDFRNSEWAKWARDNGCPDARIPERVYMHRGSWGKGWGRNGDFAMDARYVEHRGLFGDGQTLRGYANENRT